MAETTNIAWCRSTWNPWIGCTKVSPGCDHCYASVSTPVRTMGIKWGPGEARRRTSPHNWNGPLKWNERARQERESGIITTGWESWGKPGFWPVFCASLADVFDNEVDPEWRADLFLLMECTPNLTWLVLTKRIGNAIGMLPALWSERHGGKMPANVWLGATVVNQEEADRDIPKLLATPAAKRFVSHEPALGSVDWTPYVAKSEGVLRCQKCGFFTNRWEYEPCPNDGEQLREFPRIDWIIVGGESDQAGNKARPFDVQWARSTVAQCKAAGVACFVKQLGSNAVWHDPNATSEFDESCGRIELKDRAGADPAEWDEDLRVQQFPV